MNCDTKQLDYVTVDSIQWATGHTRPLMSLEDKRAKHRVHQRQFVLRQQERLDQLRRELRCQKLHLLRLQALQEVTALIDENVSLREKFASDLLSVDLEPLSEKSTPTDPDMVTLGADYSFVFELFPQMPDDITTVHKLDDPYWSPTCVDQGIAPLAWSPTTPCGFAIV